ncbi:thiol-activated cytolysin family protein [Treponema zuelzerae]|uniref:Thiol-activated cytolysin family protein n=1 Tax=Teretinema zuelzerae TaxID=156 RepID=A0AAE3EJL7_9SPIR|nr:thiol-activated cytolysin family protein [Teretinema zuelzerae]MCD1655907.1 thiol-activated cytolysin family protein [Teretinema zuelzerae]
MKRNLNLTRKQNSTTAASRFAFGLAVFAMLFQFSGCSMPGTTEEENKPDLTGLAALLAKLETPKNLTNSAATPIKSEEEKDEAKTERSATKIVNGVPIQYETTTKKFKASATYDTQVLLNPSTDVIYPGSVIVGSSIDDGSYQEVVRGRKNEIMVSYGGLNGVTTEGGKDGVVSGKIYPSLSEFRKFHNQIINQTFKGANSTYTMVASDISSEDSFNVFFSAGVSYESPSISASVKASLDYTKETTKKKYMISFAQTYYTVDIDQGVESFLYSDFNLDDFKGVRPVYVSSIAYGRLGYITLESEASLESIKAGVEAILQTPSLAVNANAGTEIKSVQNSNNLNVTVIGSPTVVKSLEDFADFLTNGGFSSESTGQIVSYKLRFVDDNSIANIVFNGEYTLRSVKPIMGKYKVDAQLTGISCGKAGDPDDDADLSGALTLSYNGTDHDLWKTGAHNLWYIPLKGAWTEFPGTPAVKNTNHAKYYSTDVKSFFITSKNDKFDMKAESVIEDNIRDDEHNDVTKSISLTDLDPDNTYTITSDYYYYGNLIYSTKFKVKFTISEIFS